jgi:hypothetical protein
MKIGRIKMGAPFHEKFTTLMSKLFPNRTVITDSFAREGDNRLKVCGGAEEWSNCFALVFRVASPTAWYKGIRSPRLGLVKVTRSTKHGLELEDEITFDLPSHTVLLKIT